MLMIWLAMVGTISQSEMCWVALTNQIHTNVVGKSYTVKQWHSDVVIQWCGDMVVEGNSNDWLMWCQWASQMTEC